MSVPDQPVVADQPVTPALPVGANTINPFIFTEDASRLISFLTEVFGAVEVMEARTADTDGLVLHSELRIGDSMLTVADRKPGWPFTPSFTQVYVDDVDAVLARAKELGAAIVTNPTEFWGDTFSRFADPQGNLWWVYRHAGADAASDDYGSAGTSSEWGESSEESHADAGDSAESWESFTSRELEYIHSTLMDAMARLRDPRA